MSLTTYSTGSDGVSGLLSGSGFSLPSLGSNPDGNFDSGVIPVKWRSVDQPWVSYGGLVHGNAIFDLGNGFNNSIYLPKQQLPSGQYDLVVELPPSSAGKPNPPLALRVNISGSIVYRTATGPAPLTAQYQDILNVPQFGNNTVPFGAPTGTPEFGPATGSISG